MIHAGGGDNLLDPRPAIKKNALADPPGKRRFTIAAIKNKACLINAAQRLGGLRGFQIRRPIENQQISRQGVHLNQGER
jgi:hypothetical protein